MGYRAMTIDMLYNLYRRWAAGQNPTEISRQAELHRSTVYAYIKLFTNLNISLETSPQNIRIALFELVPENIKPKPTTGLLSPYTDEIRGLVTGSAPMKPKSAWEVIATKYDLGDKLSYETFKRFYRSLDFSVPNQTTIRMEVEAGQEVQVDYGKMGMMLDLTTKKRFVVQAFICILSFSRLPFIQFVRTQTKASFIDSIVRMFTFYQGVPRRLNLDNLKAGVIKADVYHPDLNRSLQECADHYGFFIDPCQIRSPKEKGKVERLVPSARELFRRLVALYPDDDLAALNVRALDWCRDVYGHHVHGTTGLEPIQTFHEQEKPALKVLPDTPFELSEWGSARVHPDQYIRFKSRMYSVPQRYIGVTVQIRQRLTMLDIFHCEELIRSYVIPKGYRAYLEGDFPEATAGRHDGTYAGHLIRRAENEFGVAASTLIKKVLEVPANLTARRALGLLDQMHKHRGETYLAEVLRRAVLRHVDQPKVLAAMLDHAKKHGTGISLVTMSPVGKEMIRDITYYTN